MEFTHEITIVKAEVRPNKKGGTYQLLTILTQWGVAGIVNRSENLFIMTKQVMVVKAKLKVNLGKFTSVEFIGLA